MPRKGANHIRSDRPDPDAGLRAMWPRGVYSVARLQAKHGDARLTDLRAFLTADCPNRAKRSIHAQCQAVFDPPPETKRGRLTW
jgi:hypothetical protein